MVPVGYGIFLGGFLWAWTSNSDISFACAEATMYIGLGSMVAGAAFYSRDSHYLHLQNAP